MRGKQSLLVLLCSASLVASAPGATNNERTAAESAAAAAPKANQPPPAKMDKAAEHPCDDGGKPTRPPVSTLLAAYRNSGSDADAARFVAAALEAQQDRHTAWDTKWGDGIDELRRLGKIPDKQWKQYLTHAMFYGCVIRRRVRADTTIAAAAFERDSSDAFCEPARCETSVERSLYKALPELQPLQAARVGGSMPRPATVDVNIDTGQAVA